MLRVNVSGRIMTATPVVPLLTLGKRRGFLLSKRYKTRPYVAVGGVRYAVPFGLTKGAIMFTQCGYCFGNKLIITVENLDLIEITHVTCVDCGEGFKRVKSCATI